VQYLVDAAAAEVAGPVPARPAAAGSDLLATPVRPLAPQVEVAAADRSFDQRLAWFFDLLERQAVEQRVLR
jgi:hypothetical protein